MNKKHQFFLTFPRSKKSLSFFSLPETNQYQTIDNLKINPSSSTLIKDKRWGNNILINGHSISFLHHPKVVNQQIPEKFFLNGYQDVSNYIFTDRFINGQDKKIISLAKKIIGQEKNLDKVAKKLYDYVIGYLTYANPYEGLYSYRQALEEKKTDCGGFSTLLISLFQSLKIPSRLIVGYQLKPSLIKSLLSKTQIASDIFALTIRSLYPHVWVEIKLPDGKWFPLDPTSSPPGFGFIPADRLVISYGEDLELNIQGKKYKIDILQKPISL